MAETAGLVLGILPLVIEGLKLYVKSIETAKRYWKYAGVVSSLVETLDVERAIYNNNCVILLQDIVTENELALLLENPGGSFWKDEMLERKLTETLGKSYRPFVQVLTSMSNLMESFKREIGMEGGEVKWSDRKKFKYEWKRVVATLCTEETNTSLTKLRTYNVHLQTLLGQHEKLQPFRTKQQTTKYIQFYTNIQEHARKLYDTLKNSFGKQCGCRNMHRTKLRLEARFIKKDPLRTGTISAVPEFRVLFHLEPPEQEVIAWNWKEAMIQSAPEREVEHENILRPSAMPDLLEPAVTDSRTNGSISEVIATIGYRSSAVGGSQQVLSGVAMRFKKQKKQVAFAPLPLANLVPAVTNSTSSARDLEFDELCTKFCNLHPPTGEAELGVLVNSENGHNRLRIRLTGDLSDAEPSTVSLVELLSIDDSLRLRENRLIIGVKLASSLLQLSMTSWISGEWNTGDILFVKQRNDSTNSTINHPYVSQGHSPSQNRANSGLFQFRNYTMFEFGIILLELWFGKSMEALRPSQEEVSRISTAFKLVKDMANDAGIPGQDYATAVKFCLSLDLGGNKSNSLNTASFKEEVLTNVLWPLEEYLKSFSGKELDQLLL